MDDVVPRPGSCTAEQVRSMLADSLRQTEGCALCGLLRRLEINHVVRFATAQLQGDEERKRFHAGRLLCNWHFWEVDRSFESPRFADKLFDVLALLPADLGLGDVHTTDTLERLPLCRRRCWICHELARDEADYASALAHLLHEATFQAAYEQSRGLCLPHVHAVLEAAEPEVRDWLRRAESTHWDRLKQDLAELVRKRGPELRAQLTRSEDTAPFRCVQKLVGGPGRPWPCGPSPSA